jgi:hypothetical protein
MGANDIIIQGLIDIHLAGKGGPEAVAMMKQIVAQSKEVKTATGGIGTGLDKTTEGVGKLNAAFGLLGRTVAGYFVAGAIARFLQDSYVGFARTERQALATENQIRALGQAADGAGFRQFIQQLAATSGIIDDELIPAFQRAFGAFKNYATATEIVTIASRFAAAGIGDVISNVDAISRFFQTGQTRGLAQFGINIKGAADGTFDLATGLTELNKAAASLGGGFGDAQAKINAAKVLTDTFRDSVGSVIEKLADLTLRYSQSPLVMLVRARAFPGAGEDASIFGPQQETAAERQFREEQVKRSAEAEKKKADDALKIEAGRLDKVAEMNEQVAQDLIRDVIAIHEVGTTERLNLEIALNDRVRAEAVKNAMAIGADVAAINRHFDELAFARTRDFVNATGPAPGSGGPDPAVVAAEERRDKLAEIENQEALHTFQVQQQKTQWYVDSAKTETDAIIEAGSQAGHALSQIFSKHKGFAIGMAIMDTSNAIMQIWATSGESWYVKLAKSLAVAAIGAAQIQSIRSASVDGGGSLASGGGGGSAARSPQFAQSGGSGESPPAFTAGSGVDMAVIAGRTSASGRDGVVVNIGHAFGDRDSMTKLAREISRVFDNDPSRLR